MIKVVINIRKRRKWKERRYKHRKVGIVGAKEVGVRQNSEKVDWKGRIKDIHINQMKYAIPVYERLGVQRSVITNLTSLCFWEREMNTEVEKRDKEKRHRDKK